MLGQAARLGFTLAEVLITLGIIGVVTAITIPTLIANYQKKVYYNQFMKAVTTLENALKRYEYDHGCEGNIWNCTDGSSGSIVLSTHNFVEDLSKYFNVAQFINKDNIASVCAGYDKLPVSYYLDSSNRSKNPDDNLCIPYFDDSYDYGFITTDGMLFYFASDAGMAFGNYLDINGPNKGPNTYGRDIFIFYIYKYFTEDGKSAIKWGGQLEDEEKCDNTDTAGCAAKLLQEGKMNY